MTTTKTNKSIVGLFIVIFVFSLCYFFYPNMGRVIVTLLIGIFTFVVLLIKCHKGGN